MWLPQPDGPQFDAINATRQSDKCLLCMRKHDQKHENTALSKRLQLHIDISLEVAPLAMCTKSVCVGNDKVLIETKQQQQKSQWSKKRDTTKISIMISSHQIVKTFKVNDMP